MLCILKTPIDLAMWVKLDNLIANKKGARNGKVVVELLAKADFSSMLPDEKLVLVSHGNETKFGGLDVAALAKELVTRKLRGDVSSIKLSGCKSGSDAVGTPYCNSLSRAIYDSTKHLKPPLTIKVTGFVNSAVTFPDGRVRAKIPGTTPKTGPTYDEIIDKYKLSGDRKTWDDLAAKLPFDTEAHIIESAQLIAQLSRSMFDELYALNNQITYGKDDSKRRGTWT